MDNYFGSTLLFKTKNNIFRGKLHGMTKDNTQMIILIEDRIHKIPILEIEDLQIIDASDKPKKKSKEIDSKDFSKRNNETEDFVSQSNKNETTEKMNANKKIAGVNKTFDNKKNNKQKITDTQNLDCKNEMLEKCLSGDNFECSKNANGKTFEITKNNDQKVNKPEKSELVKGNFCEKNVKDFLDKKVELQNKTVFYNESCVKKMSNLVEKLNLSDAKSKTDAKHVKFYNDAFLFYGPTETSFVTIVGETLLEFFTELNKASFCVILNDNSVFTRIGFYLSKRFLDKNVKVSVLRKVNDSVNVATEKNTYMNLNGKIEKFTDEVFDYIIVDNNERNKYYEHLYRNVAFCLDCKNRNYKKAVGFCYGIVNENLHDFNGKVYLLDCGFNDLLYKKYDFTNECNGKITRLK